MKKNLQFFFEIFLDSGKGSAEKCKRGPLGVKRGTFETLKNAQKKSLKAGITCTKNFGQGQDSNPPPSFCLADLKKA